MNEPTPARYRQIVSRVFDQPWAIHPSKLLEIRELIRLRASGQKLTPEEVEERIGAAKSRPLVQSTGSIAVIPITGVIAPHADLMNEISGGTSIDLFLTRLRAAMDDSSISAIVLDIDSPGGSVELLAEAAAEIRAARDSKQIVGVANAFAASAAYYLLAQASTALSTPSGQIGSIGTIAIHEDISRMLDAAGVTPTIITFGEFKGEGNPLEPLSDSARAEIQRGVNSYGNEFVDDVAKGRGIDRSKVLNEFGQGRMLRAKDALNVGMIDGIASLDDTITKLLAGKPATRRTRAETDEPVEQIAAAVMSPSVQVRVIGDADSLVRNLTGRVPGFDITEGLPAEPNVLESSAAQPGASAGDISAAPAGATRATQTETRKEGSLMEPDTQTTPRTREEIVARMDEIKTRQEELDREHAGQLMGGDTLVEFNQLDDEWIELNAILEQNDARRRSVAMKAQNGSTVEGDGAAPAKPPWSGRSDVETKKNIPDNIFDLSAYRGYASSVEQLSGLWKEGAKRLNDGLLYETEKPDKVKLHVQRLLESDESLIPSESFAHRMLVAGNPAYDRAFGKWAMGRQLNTQERQLIEAAVSHTGLGAETPVPVTIDPTVILTSDGVVNPLRQMARNVTITGNKWRGVASDGVTVAYEAELTEVADQTPVFDAPEGEVAKAHGYVEFSIEVDQDWGELRSNLAVMFQDAKDSKEAEKFLFGSGTNEPEGLLTVLVGSGSEVFTATLNTFALADLYALKSALPPRFRGRAQWLANDVIYSAVRQFGDASDTTFWTDLAGDRPPLLLYKPVYEASEMSDDPTSGGDPIVVYGDFSRGFVIIDRVGLNVELIPHVMGANNRPKGARALYVYFRNTSLVVATQAFRLLTVKDS